MFDYLDERSIAFPEAKKGILEMNVVIPKKEE